MAQARWALIVDIYEPKGAGMDYPILTHIFRGTTKVEAQGYCKAHMTTDSFFRDCMESGRWKDVMCRARIYWQQLG